MIQEKYIYGALYFYHYYVSFTSDHQALHPGGWGPLLYCVARKQKQTVYVLTLLQAPLKVLGSHRWPSLVPPAGSLPAPSGSLTHRTYHLLLVPGYSMFIWVLHTFFLSQFIVTDFFSFRTQVKLPSFGAPLLTAPARVRGPSSGRQSHSGRLMRYWVVRFNSCCLPPPPLLRELSD